MVMVVVSFDAIVFGLIHFLPSIFHLGGWRERNGRTIKIKYVAKTSIGIAVNGRVQKRCKLKLARVHPMMPFVFPTFITHCRGKSIKLEGEQDSKLIAVRLPDAVSSSVAGAEFHNQKWE